MKFKISVQKRETKSYEVPPSVTVSDGCFEVTIRGEGVLVREYSLLKSSYRDPWYLSTPVPQELIRKALELWDEVK